jgi:hypothetical protein
MVMRNAAIQSIGTIHKATYFLLEKVGCVTPILISHPLNRQSSAPTYIRLEDQSVHLAAHNVDLPV